MILHSQHLSSMGCWHPSLFDSKGFLICVCYLEKSLYTAFKCSVGDSSSLILWTGIRPTAEHTYLSTQG